jgi:hypothetical protein
MRQYLVVSLFLLVLGVTFCATVRSSQDSKKITEPAILSECTLIYDWQTIKPKETGQGRKIEFLTPAGLLICRENEVELKDGATSKFKVKPVIQGVWPTAATETIAYFRGGSPSILRLNLETGQWAGELSFQGEIPPGQDAVPIAIASSGYKVAILYALTKPGDFGRAIVSNVVQVRAGPDEKLDYSVALPLADARMGGPGFLMAASYPNFADSEIRYLTWSDPDLIVCPSDAGPIFRLDWSGKRLIALDRPWEYRRNFIGPSVWSHTLGRFGVEDWAPPGQAVNVELRKKFDEQFVGKIVAGPYVFPSNHANGPNRLVVATSIANKGVWEGYTGDCIIYEFEVHGSPVTRTVVPQFVRGETAHVMPDGVVFGTQNRGRMRFMVSKESQSFGMGPGGPDLTGEISWFSQPPAPRIDYPLSADPARELLSASDKRGVQVVSGWYADSAAPTSVTFPISILDLRDGSAKPAKLHVPLPYALRRPETNYIGSHARGPHGIGITDINLKGNTLRVQIASEKSVGYMEFDLPDEK